MSDETRQRVDLWLVRARFVKTRAAAARLISEGGVRLMRDGQARRLEKPSVEVSAGDVLVFAQRGQLRSIRLLTLPIRRGPPAEAATLYQAIDGDAAAPEAAT